MLEKTMKFGRNSNRMFAVKNKEIKQIIFSRKKNKKWIIIALVLVLTLGGGSVAAVTAAVLALKCRVVAWISADSSVLDRWKRAKP